MKSQAILSISIRNSNRQIINVINRTISSENDRFGKSRVYSIARWVRMHAGGTLRTKRNMRDTLRGTLASGDVYIGGTVWHDDGNEPTYVDRYTGEDIITYNLCHSRVHDTRAAVRKERAHRKKETHGWSFAGIAIPFFFFFFPSVLALCKDVPNTRKVRTLRPAREEERMPLESVVLKSRTYDVGDAWRTLFLSLFLALAFRWTRCRQSH